MVSKVVASAAMASARTYATEQGPLRHRMSNTRRYSHGSTAISQQTLRSRSSSIELSLVGRALTPHVIWWKLWQQGLLLCVFYELLVVPYLITFTPKELHPQRTLPLLLLYACEMLFALDMIVTVAPAFAGLTKCVRPDWKKLRKIITRTPRLWLDLVILIPLSVMVSVLPSSSTPIAMLEVHKLLRVLKLRQYASVVEDIDAKHFVTLKLLKMLAVTILLSHAVACARFWFGENTDDIHNEWLPQHSEVNHTRTPQTQYLMSLFWAFGLLTGLFEGELPRTIFEFIFTIFVALCGFALFTYLCATFFMISRSEAGYTATAEARISQFKHVLAFHRVPLDLQEQAIEYLKNFYTYADANDREAIRLLCPSITKDIQVALLKDTIASIPFFLGCNEQFIIAITSLLEMVALPANTVIFEAGAFGDSMYVVNSGVLQVIAGGTKVADLRKGSCFGEMAIFLDCPRTATIVTATYCTIYKLLRLNVERVLEGYPQYAKSIPRRVEILTKSLGLMTKPSQNASEHGSDSGSENAKNMRAVSRLVHLVVTRKKAEAQSEKSTRRNSLQPIESERRLSVHTSHSARSLLELASHNASQSSAWLARRWSVMKTFPSQLVRLLPRHVVDPDSMRRMWWICALQVVLVVDWIMVPLQLAFSLLDTSSWITSSVTTVCDLILWLDIYWSFVLAYTEESERVVDIPRTAHRYLRSGFVVDVVCAFPWDQLPLASLHHAALRLPRLARVWRVGGHYAEVDAYFRIENKHRLALFALLLVMLYHVTACLYFGVTYFEGFSDDVNAWLPSLRSDNTSGYLDGGHEWINGTSVSASTIAVTQYLRSLYFASYVLTALGRTVEPASDTQYMIALAFMLTGFVITAVVVDNVQKRCTASAHEQKEFLATRLKIQLFLRRQHAPLAIHKRVNSFLDFWWFAHRGAMIGEIINELPEALKRDIMRYICAPVLQTLALLPDVRPVLDRLEDAFLNHVQFILYGQGELIYRRGDHATGVFFLLEGSVELDTGAVDPHELPAGSFFGTIGIVNATTECCHVDGAVATTGSILLFVAKEQLPALKKHFPTFDSALLMLEQRLKNSKLSHTSSKSRTSMANPAALRVFTVKKSRWRSVVEGCRAGAIDPESPYVGVWQLIVFVVMTIQWMWCTFYMCFGVDEEEFSLIHATTASLEMTFLLDMLLQLKLGYSNFGNVVMDTRLIWRRYLRSFQFRVDLIAFLPLYLYNAPMSKVRHLPLLNVNKLFRLVQVPHHFQRMETKLLKYTTELRLFKLVYYTFLLSHLFGCLWFNFASQNATNGTPAFGHGDWMPPAALMNVSRTQQYAASLFWAFGLMSASSPGELPKTIGQCFFSVVVMTTGFFLFAYVIGNFGDVIELNDAENRAFYAKLSSLRHFLSHFRVAEPMAHKFKMYFFFRRYHSITQEHLLARCLPPSLLTDIRIIHLQPMIAKVAFLAGMDTKITHLLVSRFTQVLVTRDEFVYKRGDEGSDMYFVFTGLLQSLLPDEDLAREASMPDHRTSFSRPYHTHLGDRTTAEAVRDEDSVHDAPIHQSGPQGAKLKVLTEIGAGCYFGESVLLTSGTRNTFVQAKASCMLYSLSRESLELVFDRHPEWKQKVLRSMKIHQDQQRFRRLETDELKPSHTQPHQRAAVAKIDLYNAIAERTEADILPLLKPQQSGLKRLQSNLSHLFSTMEARKTYGRRRDRRTRQSKNKPARKRWMSLAGVTTLFSGAAAGSPAHLGWLRIVVCAALYVAILEPYRIAFESLEVTHWFMGVLRELEVVCDIIFMLDVSVNYNLKQSIDSMELYEQDHRIAYVNERMTIDILAFFPVDYMLSNIGTLRKSPWLRLNRCLKMWHFSHYTFELHRDSISIELHRLASSACLYLTMMYWTAVSYFIVGLRYGYGDEWDGWMPSEELDMEKHGVTGERRALRLLRGLFFASTALVKKGRTFIPTTTLHLLFSVVVCFIGLLCMAFMIGEIAGLLISYINHEVEYRKNHIAVELYLSRWKIAGELRDRAHVYLSSLWASHRGVDYQQLLDEVPPSIRTEAILAITNWPLMAFVEDVLRPIYPIHSGGVDTSAPLLQIFSQLLRFEGYSRDENVVVEGSISKAMFFVVRGHLNAVSAAHDNTYRGLSYKGGDYFGEKGLLGYSTSACTVRTVRSCDLMSLDSISLQHALRSDQVGNVALSVAETAVHAMRFHEPLPDVIAMEDRWGSAILAAIKMRIHDLSLTDTRTSFASQRTLAVLRSRFSVDTPEEAFKLFRSLLQIMVPQGSLYNYGNSRSRRVFDSESSMTLAGGNEDSQLSTASVSSFRSSVIPARLEIVASEKPGLRS